MTYANFIFSLLISLVIGLAAWAILSYKSEETVLVDNPNLPDAKMENVSAVFMNKQGKISLRIVTPQLIHYSLNDTTDFLRPLLTIYHQSPKPWYVTANNAKAIDGIQQINFWGKVSIHHAADENNPATLIKTNTLHVFPSEHLADTSDPIVLEQPNMTIQAIGMQANMTTGEVKLLSKARGTYVPHS